MRSVRSIAVAAGVLCSVLLSSACSDEDVQAIGEDIGADQACIDGAKAMLGVAQATTWTDVEDIDGLSVRLQAFVDQVPEAISVDVRLLYERVDDYLHVYADHADELQEDDPDQAAVDAVDAAGKQLDTPAMHDAAERVTTWMADHCLSDDE